jgi:phosphate starvation-inducible protein PhoH and related proteins
MPKRKSTNNNYKKFNDHTYNNSDTIEEGLAKTRIKASDLKFRIKSPYTFLPAHQSLIELSLRSDTNIAIVDGPAGSAKTYCAVYIALTLLKSRCKDNILYVRSIVESASKKLGSLPGEVEDKFKPWSIPLIEKLEELISISYINPLLEKKYINCLPVNFLRGSTFRDNVVIIDEAQNLEYSELVTIMTRFGENCKLLVIGDSKQSDINGKSGFPKIYDAFNNEESEQQGIYTFKFTEDDITRSPLLKFIIRQLGK